MGTKRAVLVGCNYPGTDEELQGCVNDVWVMHKILVEKYGFSENDIKVLIDTDDNYPKPTGITILRALEELIGQSKPGDVLFFHYSGHGMRIEADPNQDDETGFDECIVPNDKNVIKDEDFRSLVDKLPHDVKLTIVSDSCHSGGLIEREKEQIGESFKSSRERYGNDEDGNASSDCTNQYHGGDNIKIQNKSLPLDSLLKVLKEKSGKDDVHVGNIRETLVDVFGDDVSPTVKRFVQSLKGWDNSERRGQGKFRGLVRKAMESQPKSQCFEQESSEDHANASEDNANASEYEDGGHKRGHSMGVLVSGCQSNQISADATPTNGGLAYGALTNAIRTTIASIGNDIPITNHQLVTQVRKVLADQGFTQQPGLYCNDANADAPFICKPPSKSSPN